MAQGGGAGGSRGEANQDYLRQANPRRFLKEKIQTMNDALQRISEINARLVGVGQPGEGVQETAGNYSEKDNMLWALDTYKKQLERLGVTPPEERSAIEQTISPDFRPSVGRKTARPRRYPKPRQLFPEEPAENEENICTMKEELDGMAVEVASMMVDTIQVKDRLAADPGPGEDLDPGPGEDLDPGPGEDLDPGPAEDLDPSPGENIDADLEENLDPDLEENLDPGPGENLDPGPGENLGSPDPVESPVHSPLLMSQPYPLMEGIAEQDPYMDDITGPFADTNIGPVATDDELKYFLMTRPRPPRHPERQPSPPLSPPLPLLRNYPPAPAVYSPPLPTIQSFTPGSPIKTPDFLKPRPPRRPPQPTSPRFPTPLREESPPGARYPLPYDQVGSPPIVPLPDHIPPRPDRPTGRYQPHRMQSPRADTGVLHDIHEVDEGPVSRRRRPFGDKWRKFFKDPNQTLDEYATDPVLRGPDDYVCEAFQEELFDLENTLNRLRQLIEEINFDIREYYKRRKQFPKEKMEYIMQKLRTELQTTKQKHDHVQDCARDLTEEVLLLKGKTLKHLPRYHPPQKNLDDMFPYAYDARLDELRRKQMLIRQKKRAAEKETQAGMMTGAGATRERPFLLQQPDQAERFRQMIASACVPQMWWQVPSPPRPARPVTRAPSRRAHSPRAPSPRAHITRAPITCVPSPMVPSPRAPSPRAPSPRAPSPRAHITRAPITCAPSPRARSPRAPSPCVPSLRAPRPRAHTTSAPITRAPSPRDPSPRAHSPCAPSPRAHITRAPSSRAPSPRAPSPRDPSPRDPSPRAHTTRAPSPRAPIPRAHSPRAPSPRAPSPRAPSPCAPSPRAHITRAPSPRAPSPRAPSPRALRPVETDTPRDTGAIPKRRTGIPIATGTIPKRITNTTPPPRSIPHRTDSPVPRGGAIPKRRTESPTYRTTCRTTRVECTSVTSAPSLSTQKVQFGPRKSSERFGMTWSEYVATENPKLSATPRASLHPEYQPRYSQPPPDDTKPYCTWSQYMAIENAKKETRRLTRRDNARRVAQQEAEAYDFPHFTVDEEGNVRFTDSGLRLIKDMEETEARRFDELRKKYDPCFNPP